MRNVDNKLTMLLEQSKQNDSYINNSNNKETIDYSHLDCFFLYVTTLHQMLLKNNYLWTKCTILNWLTYIFYILISNKN